MKAKIIAIFIIMLFIATTVPIFVNANEINTSKKKILDDKTINEGNLICNKSFIHNPIEEEWNKTYGESESNEYGTSVCQSTNGGFFITGYKFNSTSSADLICIKTDNEGIEIWNKTFGDNSTERGYSILSTNDNGCIITGVNKSKVWLLKIDDQGNLVWEKNWNSLGMGWDCGHSIKKTHDNGYIITGMYGGNDLWLIKTDDNGNEEWNMTFGNENYFEIGHTAIQTLEGGYIIIGESYFFDRSDRNLLVIKVDSNGNEEWNKIYGGENYENSNLYPSDIKQTSDGGYIIVGSTKSFGSGGSDGWLIKIDSNGNEQWNKTYGGVYDEFLTSVSIIENKGFVLAGTTFGSGEGDAWIIQTDFNGDVLGYTTFGGYDFDKSYELLQINKETYIFTGLTKTYGNGIADVWLLKFLIINQQPNAPIISGPTNGKVGEEYCWNISSVDPEGDDLMYIVDWGDGDTTETECYPSGMEVEVCHTYTVQGTFIIKVKAKDCPYGSESDWSEFTVTMPRDKALSNSLILRFLERYPLINRLLDIFVK